ncbi:MAG: PKD domain-containing protein [Chitinivibrionales bacterium]|nr:PKD domain-containing protein [Chitinivibrionales bacterium]
MIKKFVQVLGAVFAVSATLFAGSNEYGIDVSTYFGGSGDGEALYGAAIQSDGVLVLAGIIGDKKISGIAETHLNGATGSSSGAIIRIAADGSTVISMTRVADKIVDVCIDANDNIYCAAMDGGVIILGAQAKNLVWSKSFDGNAHRVDAGPSGYFAVLTSAAGDHLSQKINSATITVFSPQGAVVGSFGGNSHYTRDVCVDENNQTIVTTGFKNYGAMTSNGKKYPVDVPAYQGRSFDGTTIFEGYNYASSELNANGSNMADARGHRCIIGKDGYLYLVFEVDGGNFVFDNDPKDVMQNVAWTTGDVYNQSYNTGTDPSLFYGRYNPENGDYINGQFFTNRLDNNKSNTIRIKNGALAVDEDGTMYLAGASASGLPLTFDPNGGYTGGAYLLIVKSDFSQRLLCSRIGKGGTHGLAVRKNADGTQKIVWCGSAQNSSGHSLYLRNPLQSTLDGKHDGFFAFIEHSKGMTTNTPPVAAFSARQVSGTKLEFNASASSDADGDALEYIWSFNDSLHWGNGTVVQHTYPSPLSNNYRVSLTLIDATGGWDQRDFFFGPPQAAFNMSTRAGQAPLEITFNGAKTTDPNDDLADLGFDWRFDDSRRASGQQPAFTFNTPGIYLPTLSVSDNMGGVGQHLEYILVALDIAHRKYRTPVELHGAKPFYQGDYEDYAHWKGDHRLSRRFDFETLYLEKNYTLASVATNYPEGIDCFWEQSVWKMAVKGSSNGAVQIFGNASGFANSELSCGRSPYEQVGQYRNCMMRIINGADELWVGIPASKAVEYDNKTAFADLGNGVYIALIPYQATATAHETYSKDGAYEKYSWKFAPSTLGALVLEAGTKAEHGSFGGFKSAIQTNTSLTAAGANRVEYIGSSARKLRMEFMPLRDHYPYWHGEANKSAVLKTISPAGVTPKVWCDGKLLDFSKWQSWHVTHGEKIVEQNWGSGALTASVGGKGLQIIVDPATAEVEYRKVDGLVSLKSDVQPEYGRKSHAMESQSSSAMYSLNGRKLRHRDVRKKSMQAGVYISRVGRKPVLKVIGGRHDID